MIIRKLQQTIERRMFCGKAIIVTGARQVGKSTLLRQVTAGRKEKTLMLNCDEPEVQALLTQANSDRLRQLIADSRIVVVDEAQRVPQIGMTLKRIADGMPDVQLLVTGSSAFELHDRLNEPLTGRKFEYHLYPVSSAELMDTGGLLSVGQTLEQRLIYGSYPDVLNHAADARELLMNIASSYLYKDLLSLNDIRKPVLLEKLLVVLALQVGNEVSYSELAQTVGSDNKTVEKYVDLLEKCYVIFRLGALSRNLRNELKKGKKIYFHDNGVRNAIIQNFAPLNLRQDTGALWENFIISERLKRNHYGLTYAKGYFWRTTQQQEIDYVEECDGRFRAFEMKWNPRRANSAIPAAFTNAYDVESVTVVTPDSYLDAVL